MMGESHIPFEKIYGNHWLNNQLFHRMRVTLFSFGSAHPKTNLMTMEKQSIEDVFPIKKVSFSSDRHVS